MLLSNLQTLVKYSYYWCPYCMHGDYYGKQLRTTIIWIEAAYITVNLWLYTSACDVWGVRLPQSIIHACWYVCPSDLESRSTTVGYGITFQPWTISVHVAENCHRFIFKSGIATLTCNSEAIHWHYRYIAPGTIPRARVENLIYIKSITSPLEQILGLKLMPPS